MYPSLIVGMANETLPVELFSVKALVEELQELELLHHIGPADTLPANGIPATP